jgi:hypothetical protein
MYVPINSAPAEAALLVQAALKNNGKIALLPEGEATVRSVSERNVEAQGNKQHLTLYSISGLDFSPIYVWLDDRGQFFAMGDSWAMFIREGWEPVAKSLQEVRSEVVQARAAELAKKLAHHPSNGIVFTHANVFDASTATVLSDQSVVVIGNHIQSIGPAKEVTIPPGTEVVDATHKTLLPGLWMFLHRLQ